MAWHDIIGQNRVKEALQRGIQQKRVAHAYLFYGPEGVGKRAMALEMAAALLCDQEEGEACDVCRPCTKVKRMVHPDLHVLFPQPSDADPHDVAERLKQYGSHPYEPFDFVRRPSLQDPEKTSNKQAIFSVQRVHTELRAAMSLKPVEGQYKIGILIDVELMRTEAANAFLKLLEEPAPQTVFILISSRSDQVLPTILSRCQRLRFDPLKPAEIEGALKSRKQVPDDEAATLARMANGSFTRALNLVDNDALIQERNLVIDYFRFSYTSHVNKLSDLIQQLNSLGRERLKGVMRLMLSWLRDLMLYRVQGEEADIVNIDQLPTIRRFCENVPKADMEAMVDQIEQALELIARNAHVILTLTVLAQSLHKAMRGASQRELYVDLTDVSPATTP